MLLKRAPDGHLAVCQIADAWDCFLQTRKGDNHEDCFIFRLLPHSRSKRADTPSGWRGKLFVDLKRLFGAIRNAPCPQLLKTQNIRALVKT